MTAATPPLVPLDFTIENYNSCRPIAFRADKDRSPLQRDLQNAVWISRVFNDLSCEFTICEIHMNPRKTRSPKFSSLAQLMPLRNEDISSEKKENRKRRRENEPSTTLRKRYEISLDINRASRTKDDPLPRRGTSRRNLRYNMNILSTYC